jgi:cytoskeletal protein CcmA (bactofilin family)
MFEKRSKPYTDLLGKTNRIVEGTVITGNIESIADFRLDGHLIGDFTSKGKLVVGPTGSIVGTIIVVNMDLEGSVDGIIKVQDHLSIKEKSSLKGNVYCGKLSVESGADFNATCVMKDTTDTTNEKKQ